MIYLYTDFGVQGPYVGQMKSVLGTLAPDIIVIDLMHDVPAFNPRAGAILLSCLTKYLHKESIVLAIVDPAVGDPARRPVMIEADGHWFVGPDNGLFQQVVDDATQVSSHELIPETNISKSFHGRDVFAPAAGLLATNYLPASKPIHTNTLQGFGCLDRLTEIIYVDHYGNAMTGIKAENLDTEQVIKVDSFEVFHADTFSSVELGKAFWYQNSIGLVEISINQGSAAAELGLFIGRTFKIV